MKERHILVIDDEKMFLIIIERFLTRSGYTIRTAESAHEGMMAALKEAPELILLDNMMVDRTGMEMLEDLQSMPDLRGIPVIMITASNDRDVVGKAINLGVNDFLIKPLDLPLLLKRVQKFYPIPNK